MNKNYLLGINLAIRLSGDKFTKSGKEYLGILRDKLPSEGNIYGDLYSFTEVVVSPTIVRRNVCTYEGKHITATRRITDGKTRLNFKNLHIDGSFNVDRFSIEVANEIREALKGFVED